MNKIILGDNREVLKTIPDGSVDLIITSPPYKNADGFSYQKISELFHELYRVQKENTLFFLNFGSLVEDKFRPFQVCKLAMDCGYQLNDTVVWIKNHNSPIQGNTRLNNLTEFIFILYKGKTPPMDRLSIGIPYVDKSNIGRYSSIDLKCGGNVWCAPNIDDEDEIKLDPSSHFNRIYSVDEQYFENIDSSDKAYIAGFLWADGYIYKERRIVLELSSKDVNHLFNIRSLLKSNHPIKTKIFHAFGKQRENVNLTINSKKLASQLLDIGFKDRLIPKNIPEKFEKDFILGLFDGDGSIGAHQSGLIMYFLGHPPLLEWIKSKIESYLNFKINNTLVDLGKISKLQIAGSKVDSIMQWLYSNSNIFLERKARKFSDFTTSNELWYIPYQTINRSNQKAHHDIFPLELPERCIKLCGYNVETVLDPYMGSGTTCLATKKLGKQYIGIELNVAHVNTAKELLNES